MRVAKIAMLSILACVGLLIVGWYSAKARSFQVFGDLSSRVETERRVVALTFDDGPHPGALGELLPMLRARGAKATFFVTGAELQRYPELGAALVAEGHELGNHTYAHRRMVLKSQAFIASEIESTDALIRATGQAGRIHFRPPYGVKGVGLPYYLANTGRRTIMWDVEPDSDAKVASSSAAIVSHVMERARPGSIILLHVMYPSRRTSLEAVPGIVDGLRSQGYEFVTVSELVR